MPRVEQSRGDCAFCGQVFSKSGMTKHLTVCAERKDAISKAAGKKGKLVNLYHLRIQAAEQGQYWLDLEMKGTATLEALDEYLRAIWLECCGHMSKFFLGGPYCNEVGMSRKADNIFAPGLELTHIYDFGTSSETQVKVVGVREGQPVTSRTITLMARNEMPEEVCIECQKPAQWLCMECLYEDGEWQTFCGEHLKHDHEEYEPMPLVNSPRMGMCAYSGPADPP
jgi:hypothetical protein